MNKENRNIENRNNDEYDSERNQVFSQDNNKKKTFLPTILVKKNPSWTFVATAITICLLVVFVLLEPLNEANALKCSRLYGSFENGDACDICRSTSGHHYVFLGPGCMSLQ